MNNDTKLELRYIDENGVTSTWVDGYGAVFNKLSKRMIDKNGNFFLELIHPNAFDEVLQLQDLNVIMNFDHDNKQLLARTKSGTLILSVDDYGLKYSFKLPNTQLGNDIRELIQRGDIFESSFAFIPDYKSITTQKHIDNTIIRTINKISGLYDCALVIDGAYSDTFIELNKRDYDKMSVNEPKNDFNEIENLKIKINLLRNEY